MLDRPAIPSPVTASCQCNRESADLLPRPIHKKLGAAMAEIIKLTFGEGDEEPQPTHIAWAINDTPGYDPEWIRCGPVTLLPDGTIMGRFTGLPASSWGWKWYAFAIGTEPPPLPPKRQPIKAALQSASSPAEATSQPAPPHKSEPLPGEEDEEPQGFFTGGEESA